MGVVYLGLGMDVRLNMSPDMVLYPTTAFNTVLLAVVLLSPPMM
jgi:hypothetical protein